MTESRHIIFHGNSYGINSDQARLMLGYSSACGGRGSLNSVGVLANSPHFDACADILRPHLEHVTASLQINLTEGPCCAEPKRVSRIVDEKGMFSASFSELASLCSSKDTALQHQLALEITAQINRYIEGFPQEKDHMRICGHDHVHSIPLVLGTLLECLEEIGCTFEFMSVPDEPHGPFLRTPGIWFDIPTANYFRQHTLHRLWQTNRAEFDMDAIPTALFCGTTFYNRMDYDLFSHVLPPFLKLAHSQQLPLEIQLYPAGCQTPGECLDPRKTSYVQFYTDKERTVEGEALRVVERYGYHLFHEHDK